MVQVALGATSAIVSVFNCAVLARHLPGTGALILSHRRTLLAVATTLEWQLSQPDDISSVPHFPKRGAHVLMLHVMHNLKGKVGPLHQLLMDHDYPMVVFPQEN